MTLDQTASPEHLVFLVSDRMMLEELSYMICYYLGREGLKGERGDYGTPGRPGPMGDTADAEKGDRGTDGK